MKKFLFILILASLQSIGFAQNQNTADEKAIIETIENESRYFWARDYKNWKKQWIHEKYIVWTAASDNGVNQYEGWEAWDQAVQQLFEEDPKPIPYDGDVTKSDYAIRIYNHGAWVYFKQVNKGVVTKESRIMEKQGGKWRIAAVQLFFDTEKVETTSNTED